MSHYLNDIHAGIVASLCALFVFLVPLFCHGQGIEQAVLDELRVKAVPEWERIESAYKCFQSRFQETYQNNSPGSAPSVGVVEKTLAYCEPKSLTLLRTSELGSVTGSIGHRVCNKRYLFRVGCEDQTKKGVLAGLQVLTPGATQSESPGFDFENGLPTWRLSRFVVLKSTRVAGVPLRQIFFDDTGEFQLQSAHRFVSEGREAIVVQSKFIGEVRPGRVDRGVYFVELDPENSYRISKVRITGVNTTYEILLDYYPSVGTFPCAVKTSVTTIRSSSETVVSTNRYQLPEPFSIPEEEFFLPHYGFSEEVLETLTPNPWPRWLLIGGGTVAIALAAWLLRKRHALHVAGSAPE